MSRERLELFSASAGALVTGMFAAAGMTLIAALRSEPVSGNALLFGAAGGFLALAFGSALWRMAIFNSTDLGISVMAYLAPALSLAWLFAFGRAGDASPAYLLVGASLAVAASIATTAKRSET